MRFLSRLFFFFSSRRRHTRLQGDWSSDVCSSDLHFVQRTKTGEFHAPTRSQLQRGSADPQLIPAKEAMARSVLCLAEDQTLADVANLMSSKDVDRFPVVRQGVVVGFLTRADVVRRLIAP